MITLEDLTIKIDGLLFKPQTKITFNLKNGTQTSHVTPLSTEDFTKIWETKKNRIKIITGQNSYALVIKREVVFYYIRPIQK